MRYPVTLVASFCSISKGIIAKGAAGGGWDSDIDVVQGLETAMLFKEGRGIAGSAVLLLSLNCRERGVKEAKLTRPMYLNSCSAAQEGSVDEITRQ